MSQNSVGKRDETDVCGRGIWGGEALASGPGQVLEGRLTWFSDTLPCSQAQSCPARQPRSARRLRQPQQRQLHLWPRSPAERK